ncbi:Putative DNA helicase ino80 [Venturia effusa]|uniref:Chromatin-remodeling ATPase INO80 n=1 Tax=Venturia effusa TaxID=50376 RepID=A0A517L3M9_9PEZI|nr:Putative DNA helicase ino80 [Venturia effusa]
MHSPTIRNTAAREPLFHSPGQTHPSTHYYDPTLDTPRPQQPLESFPQHPTQPYVAPDRAPPPLPMASPMSPRVYHAPPSGYMSHERRPSIDVRTYNLRVVDKKSTDTTLQKTPSRAADPMSISSIMSGNEPEPPAYNSRRSSRASVNHTAMKQEHVAALAPPHTPTQAHTHMAPAAAPLLNGDAHHAVAHPPVLPLPRPKPDEKEVEAELAKLESSDLGSLDAGAQEIWREEYIQRSLKRTRDLGFNEAAKRKRRRLFAEKRAQEMLEAIANQGRKEYNKANEESAWKEVQAKEIAEEKERKKDMQRKRRREKTLANESARRQEALDRLALAADDDERDVLIREAAKHDKKVRVTTQLLHGGTPSKELQEATPQRPNLEGGMMTTFPMDESAPRKRGQGPRTGPRPRKSKEQKQAEKDQAAAAQAALERGDDLPMIAPRESARLEALERVESLRDSDDLSAAEESPMPTENGVAPFTSKAYIQLYEQIWKEIGNNAKKVYRIKKESLEVRQSNQRKTAQLAGKEARRWQLRTNKSMKEVQARAKRGMREMATFWKRNERDERDQRKTAERQELENAKKAEADREANRQKRKLNFLISQTELYSHFIGKKVKTAEAERHEDTADDKTAVEGDLPDLEGGSKVTNFEDLDFDADDDSKLKEAAAANARHAVEQARKTAQDFNGDNPDENMAAFDEGEMNFQNPTSLQTTDLPQPKMLSCQLKEYQLKGLNWLVNLYEQGINGILADEMGLGKTVQSISVMAYLAEAHNIWGPFLVIAPASTLHNWQQEIAKFVPSLKVLPYWGNARDRKVLRKFWDRKHIVYGKDSPFHVLVTSYQLVVQDTQYFQKIKWQYMILDEAQAIKSSTSSRWKALLAFHCRNRLLLTGTPIQNNMQELWALLHFIMPTLFDSHDEFSEWFSKDIESHAQSNTKLNEDQLKRLHMILKPFMLRRIKKNVQKELGDKIELDVYCDLTYRQRAYYANLRNKISIMDLIEKAAVGDDQDTATLMNLVMQFRKVCNHPDLFERAETRSPFSFSNFAETASFMREGLNVNVAYSSRNLIQYNLPRLVYKDGGKLDVPGTNNQKAGWRGRYLNHMMNIWQQDHILQSSRTDGSFSWLRFADTSPHEAASAARQGLFDRAVQLRSSKRELSQFTLAYDGEDGNDFTPTHALFNIAEKTSRKALVNITSESHLGNLLNISKDVFDDSGLAALEPCGRPSVTAPPIELFCSSQAAVVEKQDIFFNVPARSALYGISEKTEEALIDTKADLSKLPPFGMLPEPVKRKARYTHISTPSMRRFVTDSGKLGKLDALLRELKEGGHRVLLYFQMTRMIDLMEEYLTYRNYKYCRLDGSTKLEDRRDTVADFQTRPEIFVFLLSTRAGGLGINLTSADTVIFYDSDWNPTIDSQAMDRAHRLGQTRQVTVYRMITRGTIEERIRKRALQKEEVQRVVISGGAGVDFNTRSRENRTKDIAMWLADDEQAAEIEKKEQEIANDPKIKEAMGKKRKATKKKEMNLDDMYHEGEGHFDDNSAKASGAATPIPTADGPPSKKKKGVSKKAKSVKERLAYIDGGV